MANLQQSLTQAVAEKLAEMEERMTDEQFREVLRRQFSIFLEKMRGDKSPVHTEALINALNEALDSPRFETRVAAAFYLYAFLCQIPDKGRKDHYSRFVGLLESEVASLLYDNFAAIQQDCVDANVLRDNLAKRGFKQNLPILALALIQQIMTRCASKFGGMWGSKERGFERFLKEMDVEAEISEDLQHYRNYNFDLFESNVDFFEREEQEDREEFRAQTRAMLQELRVTRTEMRDVLEGELDDDTARIFDDKTAEFKNRLGDLQNFVAAHTALLDEPLAAQLAKEENFARFILSELMNSYGDDNPNISIEDAVKIIARRYEQIFSDEVGDQTNVSHESIKVPEFRRGQTGNLSPPRADLESIVTTKQQSRNRESNPNNLTLGNSNSRQFPSQPVDSRGREELAIRNTNNDSWPPGEFQARMPSAQNMGGAKNFDSIFEQNRKASNTNIAANTHAYMEDSRNHQFEEPQSFNSAIKNQFENFESYQEPHGQTFRNAGYDTFKKPEEAKFQSDGNQPKNRFTDAFDQFENLPGSIAEQSPGKRRDINQLPTTFEDFGKAGIQFSEFSAESNRQEPSFKKNIGKANTFVASREVIASQGFERKRTSFSKKVTNFKEAFNNVEEYGNLRDSKNVSTSVQTTSLMGGNLRNSKQLMSLSGIEKRTSSAFLDRRSNTRFNFGTSRAGGQPSEQSHMSETREALSSAMNKVSTIMNHQRVGQNIIKPFQSAAKPQPNYFSLYSEQQASGAKQPSGFQYPTEGRDSPKFAAPLSFNGKQQAPFTPTYPPLPSDRTKSRSPDAKGQNVSSSPQNNSFHPPQALIDPQPMNPNLRVSAPMNSIETPFDRRRSKPMQLESIKPIVGDAEGVFELDDFNSVHSERIQTPPEASINNYSNMIPANLKMPAQNTPSHSNFSHNIGTFLPTDEISPSGKAGQNRGRTPYFASTRSPILPFSDIKDSPGGQDPNHFDLGVENSDQMTLQHPSGEKSARVLSLEGTARNEAKKLKSKKSGSVKNFGLLTSEIEAKEIDHPSRADISDNFSQFVIDEKIVQAKIELETNIESHKHELVQLNKAQGRRDRNTPTKRDDHADKQMDRYSALFEKMIGDYENLISNHKFETKELRHYIDDLSTQNEKYKYKTFNLENEIITLKENNTRMNVSLSTSKKKYESGLNKQKEQIKQASEAKTLAIERSYQEKIQTLKKTAEINNIKLNEEMNNYAIENNNLKIEIESLQTNSNSQYYTIKESLEMIRQNSTIIQSDLEAQVKNLREELLQLPKNKTPRPTEDLVKVRQELEKSMRNERNEKNKNEELTRQLLAVSNEVSVLRSNVTNSAQTYPVHVKNELVVLKTKIGQFKQGLKEADWVTTVAMSNLKHQLEMLGQKKRADFLKRASNFDFLSGSQIAELSKLNFTCQSLKEENMMLKEKNAQLLEQNTILKRQVLENGKRHTGSSAGISTDAEFVKKMRKLEYENRSLADINRGISAELIEAKEHVIFLDSESKNTEKLIATLKHMEKENEELMEINKELYVLVDTAPVEQRPENLREKMRVMRREIEQLKFMNTQLLERMPQSVNTHNIMILNNNTSNNSGGSTAAGNPVNMPNANHQSKRNAQHWSYRNRLY